MALLIDDNDLNTAQITEDELRLEIAVLLYRRGNFSIGKASEFARMNKFQFPESVRQEGGRCQL